MPIRQHETVAVRPVGVGGVVAHNPVPEHFCDIRHAHRRAGVATVGGLDGVHSKGANGVGQFNLRGHEGSGSVSVSGRALLSAKQD